MPGRVRLPIPGRDGDRMPVANLPTAPSAGSPVADTGDGRDNKGPLPALLLVEGQFAR
ncbi:hypothetical protein [Kibdelosporangium philippinense]|uniref:hypothetical protein n=1 Tax=Kibdelosporangium philippinense TaxID=211113 RepID=UPI00361CD6E6